MPKYLWIYFKKYKLCKFYFSQINIELINVVNYMNKLLNKSWP
jgi:hypothetical protein